MLRLTAVALLALLMCSSCRTAAVRRAVEADAWPDPFLEPTAALMWPGVTRAFQVQPSGDLYNGVWSVRFDARVDGERAAAPHRIAFDDRWLPVVRWTRHMGATRWDFEAVAAPVTGGELGRLIRRAGNALTSPFEPSESEWSRRVLAGLSERELDRLVVRSSRRVARTREDERGLVVSVVATATNHSRQPHDAWLGVDFQLADSTQPFWEGGIVPAGPLPWSWASPASDSAIGVGPGKAAGGTWQRSWTLAPGGSVRVRFAFPSYPMRRDDLSDWMQPSHRERVEATTAFWRREVERGTVFDLGDPELERAIRGARVVLLACRERRGGHWVPLGGPFHYRDVWLRDGARAIRALAVQGYTDEARSLAAGLLEWQWPHGPFVSQGAQLDGTGQALWAFEQAFLRPAPALGTRRYAEAARRAVLWCERVRSTTHDAQVAATMLPYADPRDNELIAAPLVGTDAWAIAGYRAAARLLRAARLPGQAEEVDRALQHYRSAFRQALERTGSSDVPPSWTGGGLDWGNLAAAWPCGAISPQDARVAALSRRYWRQAGGPGLGFYGEPAALHGYVAADLGVAAMLAGRRDEADRVLGALVHWRNASGGACELFRRGSGDYGVNLPPHATAAAALLNLAREAVIHDDDDTLRLTLGARSPWWRHGARVLRAPTRWGSIALSFALRGDVAEWEFTPVAAWTELTLPPGTRFAGWIDRPRQARAAGDRVLVPPGTSRVRVTVRGDADRLASHAHR